MMRDKIRPRDCVVPGLVFINIFMPHNAVYSAILPCGSEAVCDHTRYDERDPGKADHGGQTVSQK